MVSLSSFRDKAPVRIVTETLDGHVHRADSPFQIGGSPRCAAVLVRNDGWTLGVTSLSDYTAAKRMWEGSWVGVIHPSSGRSLYF